MKANFRRVFVYNLDVVTAKASAVLPDMANLIAILDRRRGAGQAHVSVQGGDVDVTIGDIEIDAAGRRASILIRASDRHSADPVHSNIRTGIFRAHAKGAGEGGELGAHLFISLAAERGAPNRYTCVVEKVTGLDIRLIRRVLNRILRDEYDADPTFHSYPHPAGQRTRAGGVAVERCLPRFEFEGRPSDTLAADVQRGRLTGITLMRAVAHTPVGGVPYITKKESHLTLDIDQGGLTQNVWGDVRRALRSEAGQYAQAQIGLRLPGVTKTVSVRVDTANGAPLDDLYVRSHDFTNIVPPMAQSSRTIVPQLAGRAITILNQERNI